MSRNYTKSLSGIETLLPYFTEKLFQSSRNYTKSLSGIETQHKPKKLLGIKAAITLNPYQGLKRYYLLSVSSSALAAITLNPYQGLKPSLYWTRRILQPHCAAITLNPYQGLKLSLQGGQYVGTTPQLH